jgi:hypothetical protein
VIHKDIKPSILAELKQMARYRGVVVTLVHGTWGRNSPFTRVDSPLRKYLQENLGGEVRFLSFEWNGSNTNTARLQAGNELAEFLKRAFKTHAGFAHVVVCHSHGGNVALYSLRDRKVRERLDGIVSVATPFLASTNESEKWLDNLEMPLLFFSQRLSVTQWFRVGILIVAVFLGTLALNLGPSVRGFHLLPMFYLLAVVLVLFGIPWVRRRFSMAHEQIANLRQPDPIPVPMLCLRVRFDEPGFFLQALSFIGSLPLLIYQALAPITLWAAIIISALSAVPFVVSIFCRALRQYSLESALMQYAGIGALIVFGLLLLNIGCSVLCSLALNLALAHPAGFGLDSWTQGWFVRLCVAAEPNDPRICVRSFPTSEIKKSLKGDWKWSTLRHSVLFRYVPALSETADFIGQRSGLGRRCVSSSQSG